MALQAKAKGAPSHRFYLLYDKLYRKDVLQYAYDRCKANQGAPGVDKQDFADIAAYGEDLGELAEKLLCVPKTQIRTYWWCSPPTSA